MSWRGLPATLNTNHKVGSSLFLFSVISRTVYICTQYVLVCRIRGMQSHSLQPYTMPFRYYDFPTPQHKRGETILLPWLPYTEVIKYRIIFLLESIKDEGYSSRGDGCKGK